MGACTQVRQRQKTATASKNRVVNESLSVVVLKQLMEVSLSCITYIRGLLPEENYESTGYSGVMVKVLRRNFCADNNRLIDIMENGVYDALERKFLRVFTIALLSDPKKSDSVVESYSFNVTYGPDHDKINISDKTGTVLSELTTENGLRHQTLRLIRSLVTMVQTLSDLPDGCYLTMRLQYYDDRTPPNYQPKYFRNATSTLQFRCEPRVNTTLGSLSSNHHGVRVDLRSLCDELDQSQVDNMSQHQRAEQKEESLKKKLNDSAVDISKEPRAKKHDGSTRLEKQVSSPPYVEEAARLTDSQVIGESRSATRHLTELLERTKISSKEIASSPSNLQAREQKKQQQQQQVTRSCTTRKQEKTPAEAASATLESKSKKRRGAEETPAQASAPLHGSKQGGNGQVHDASETECVCGLKEEDSGMVECEKCKRWSHVVCWGYYHDKDPRVLSTPFLCHKCNENVDASQISVLRNLALLRTVVAVSWNEISGETWDDTSIVNRLFLPRKVARQILERLNREGVCAFTTSEPKNIGSAKRTCYRYRMLKTEQQAKDKVRYYFNPQLLLRSSRTKTTATTTAVAPYERPNVQQYNIVSATQDTEIIASQTYTQQQQQQQQLASQVSEFQPCHFKSFEAYSMTPSQSQPTHPPPACDAALHHQTEPASQSKQRKRARANAKGPQKVLEDTYNNKRARVSEVNSPVRVM